MSNKVTKYLASLRFTLLIIGLLSVMCLLGLWIPQERLISDQVLAQWQHNSPKVVATLTWLGFLHIYSSPTMLTLWGAFFVNLALVMWQRIPLIKKRISISESRIADPASAPGYPFRASYPLPEGVDGAKVMAHLQKNRYTLIGHAGGFFGVKNRLSPIAFGLFHLSFFLILVGGVISVYTKFMGVVSVAEGETFQGEVQRYEPTPQLPKVGVPPRVNFTVQSVKPQLTQGMATGLRVNLVEADGTERIADVNRPYVHDHSTFIVDNVGVAPLFVVRDASGKEIDGAFMKLDVMGGKEDTFRLAGYIFRARFFPDYVVKNGQPATASREFKNPTFVISVLRQGRQVAVGTVPPNGVLPFEGNELVLKQLPLTVRFSVIKEYGLSLIFAGFGVASLAVIWRFLLYRRELLGAIREEEGERRLFVAGKSEFYKSLAEDEFSALFGKLLEKSGSTNL